MSGYELPCFTCEHGRYVDIHVECDSVERQMTCDRLEDWDEYDDYGIDSLGAWLIDVPGL